MKQISTKKVLVLLLVFSMLATMMSCGNAADDESDGPEAGENGVVYVYNYGDYVDPDLVDQFEEETGITVVYDTFDTNEEMYPIVANDTVHYDVVGSGEYMAQKLIANDLLYPLNKENIPNLEYIDDMCKEFSDDYDPGQVYTVPYTWGTVGILYNSRNIADGEITSWADLWDEKYYDNIMMMDSIRDAFMIAQKLQGRSANTVDEQEISEATDLLIEQKELVYRYGTDSVRDFLLNESADIGVIYSGEALYCQDEDEDMHYVLPEEGTNIWFDTWTIPKTAENKENAEAWINFMCRPDVAFKTYEYLHYPTPNTGAAEMIAEEYPEDLENPALFPADEIIKKCEVYHYLGPDADKIYSKYWKELKTS